MMFLTEYKFILERKDILNIIANSIGIQALWNLYTINFEDNNKRCTVIPYKLIIEHDISTHGSSCWEISESIELTSKEYELLTWLISIYEKLDEYSSNLVDIKINPQTKESIIIKER